MVFCSWSLNLIYQFWVHTAWIRQAAAVVRNCLQYLRRTTGSTTEWILRAWDKNYGGILHWDRLFAATELFRNRIMA